MARSGGSDTDTLVVGFSRAASPPIAFDADRSVRAPFVHSQLAEAFEVEADFQVVTPSTGVSGSSSARNLAAEVGSGLEDFGGVRQGHAGPVLPQGYQAFSSR